LPASRANGPGARSPDADRALPAAATTGQGLPPRYRALFRVWFLCGIPAFSAVLAILALTLAKPMI